MTKKYAGEQWKTVKFLFEYTNDFILQVSNHGRLRTFNNISDGNIINGSMINGYRILRLKLYSPRDEKVQKKLDYLQKQVFTLNRKVKALIVKKESKRTITDTTNLLNVLKKHLSQKFQADLKERTINYHVLVHRLVAKYYLKKPTSKQSVVAHLDFEKLNNKASNLQWMTPDENYEHQKNSPYVIKEKRERKTRPKENSKATKLTVAKVKQLKKMIIQGVPMKKLAQKFNVTETQIYRIKRGENWPEVKAAT